LITERLYITELSKTTHQGLRFLQTIFYVFLKI